MLFPTKIVTRFDPRYESTDPRGDLASARHSPHKAVDDLLCVREDLKLG